MEEPEIYDSGGPRRGLLLDRALADAGVRVPLDTPLRPDQVHRWARGTATPRGSERALLLVALLAPDALRRLEVF